VSPKNVHRPGWTSTREATDVFLLLLLLDLLTLGALAAALWYARRQGALLRRESARQEAVIEALQADLAGLCAAGSQVAERLAANEEGIAERLADGLGHWEGRLLRVEQGLRRLEQRQDAADWHEPGEQVYGAAIKLAGQGADAEQLMSTFGMARGEAELIMTLHRQAGEGAIN
jgi:hypothetical protein